MFNFLNHVGFATILCAAADTNKGSGAAQDKFANIRGVIDSRIDALKASEATTAKELGLISRDLLDYVIASNDVGRVNRLLEVLTKKNREMSILFFKAFLPWKFEETPSNGYGIFTKRFPGEKKVEERVKAIGEFLLVPDNNIWTWERVNVQPMERKVNFDQNIQNLLTRALDPDNKDHIDVKTALHAVVSVISLDDITNYVTDALKVKEEEEAKLKAAAEALAKQQEEKPVVAAKPARKAEAKKAA